MVDKKEKGIKKEQKAEKKEEWHKTRGKKGSAAESVLRFQYISVYHLLIF